MKTYVPFDLYYVTGQPHPPPDMSSLAEIAQTDAPAAVTALMKTSITQKGAKRGS